MLDSNAIRVANLRVIVPPEYPYFAIVQLFVFQCNYIQLRMKCN
jgi:hypothetical protein